MISLFYILVLYFLWSVLRFDKKLIPFIILSLFIRAIFLFYHHQIARLPDSGNALNFEQHAIAVASSNYSDIMLELLLFGQEFYSVMLGVVLKVFENPPFAGELINVFLTFGAVIFSYKIVFLITESRVLARRAFVVLLFIPFLNIYSVILLREAIFVFFMTGSVYFLLNAKPSWRSGQTKSLILSMCFLLGAIAIQPGAVGVAIGLGVYTLIGVVGSFAKLKVKKNLLVFWLMLIVGLAAVFYTNVGDYKLSRYQGDFSAAMDKQFTISERLSVRDDVFFSVSASNRLGILKYPINVVEFISRPTIVEVKAFFGAVKTLETILFVIMLLFVLVRFSHIKGDSRSQLLLWVIFGLILAFALGSTEVSQGFRHKAKLYTLLVPMFFIVLNATRQDRFMRYRYKDNCSGFRHRG